MFIYNKAGINLTSQKKHLVAGRLQQVVKRLNLSSFEDYYRSLKSDKKGILTTELIDKISTNHTFFNREKKHFDLFRETILPDVVKRSKGVDIKIWCAAASTGEEPYMLAILQNEVFKNLGFNLKVKFLATDISTEALIKAKQGIYNAERVISISKSMLNTYFNRLDNGKYQVIDSVRTQILYKRFNLMDKFPFKGKFDIIFARNVMIYFDNDTKARLVQKFYDYLNPGGYLFIGYSESLDKKSSRFIVKDHSLFQKPY
ncbi:MAG: chemotaxis protein CheR [Candidatus Cloacimonadota bacterium]|nr:MAG: chemotaxis protein CheR [Candidatus Cloacimonadota bacterium]PIE77658.1 MAG: chemotaxis protein CheR [Candidatus Delongbacteria bacterium]